MKEKILIYDDDHEILLLCKTILSKYGFETETRTECEDILSEIESINPDLILIDLQISGIGGEKAIVLVKGNVSTRHIPVLVFSANPDIAAISKKVKAEGFVEKPFTIPDFISTMKHHLLKSSISSTSKILA